MLYKLETFIERLLFNSRWLLVPFFLGLMVVLIGYVMHFMLQIGDMFSNLTSYGSDEMLVVVLQLVDKVLVSSLIVMVIIGGYESSVSKLNITDRERKVSWLGKLDASSLKIKLATSIISISSVHMLQLFMNINNLIDESGIDNTSSEVKLSIMVYIIIVLAAILLASLDWIRSKTKQLKD